MATAFREEGEVAAEDHQRHMKEVEEVSGAMGEYGTRVLEAARGRFEESREGVRNGCSEEYNVMKATMQARIQEVENILSERHQAYLKANGDRSKVWASPLPTWRIMAASCAAQYRFMNPGSGLALVDLAARGV